MARREEFAMQYITKPYDVASWIWQLAGIINLGKYGQIDAARKGYSWYCLLYIISVQQQRLRLKTFVHLPILKR